MKRVVVLAVCIVVLCAVQANAALIGSWTILVPEWTSSIETNWIANLSIGDDMTDSDGRTSIFNGLDEDGWSDSAHGVGILGSVGQTVWVASSQDDPDFDVFVSRITDGTPDNVQAMYGDGHGGFSLWVPIYRVLGWPDQGSYNFDYADLHGYSIERIGLTVNSASHSVVSGEHVYAWDVTYTFEGTPVPEPASLVGLAAGIGALGVMRFRRRRC